MVEFGSWLLALFLGGVRTLIFLFHRRPRHPWQAQCGLGAWAALLAVASARRGRVGRQFVGQEGHGGAEGEAGARQGGVAGIGQVAVKVKISELQERKEVSHLLKNAGR